MAKLHTSRPVQLWCGDNLVGVCRVSVGQKSTLCAYQMAVPASLAHHRSFVLGVSMFWDFGSLYYTTLRRPWC